MRQPTEFSLTLQTVYKDDTIIESASNIPFIAYNENGIRKSTILDENYPLRVEFLYDSKIGNVKFNLSIKHSRGDAVKLLKSYQFWNSLKRAKQLKIIELPSKKIELVPIQGGELCRNQ